MIISIIIYISITIRKHNLDHHHHYCWWWSRLTYFRTGISFIDRLTVSSAFWIVDRIWKHLDPSKMQKYPLIVRFTSVNTHTNKARLHPDVNFQIMEFPSRWLNIFRYWQKVIPHYHLGTSHYWCFSRVVSCKIKIRTMSCVRFSPIINS